MTPFAFLGFNPERANAFFLYLLAIVGGGVAGYFGGWLLANLFDRAVLGKGRRSPEFLRKVFRVLTGLAAAVLIAIFLFPGGGGGRGTGDGPGDGPKKSGGPTDGTGGPDPKAPPATTPASPGQTLAPDQKAIELIRLEILGGSDVTAGTDFYREVGKPEQLTLADVETKVRAKQAALKDGVTVAIEYRFTRHSGPDFQGTTTLLNWAKREGITTKPAEGN